MTRFQMHGNTEKNVQHSDHCEGADGQCIPWFHAAQEPVVSETPSLVSAKADPLGRE